MADTGSEKTRSFWQDESGAGVIEMVLIIVVLIGLVLIFRNSLTALLNSIFEQIKTAAESVY